MKKKGLLGILAPLVLLIWGIIAYRLFLAFDGSKAEPVQKTGIMLPVREKDADTARYTLRLDYEDPFLRTKKKAPPVTSPKKSSPQLSVKAVRKAAEPQVIWPSVRFKGIIRKVKGEEATCLMEVNEQPLLLSPGETSSGLRVFAVYEDSVGLEYGKMRKFFKKEP